MSLNIFLIWKPPISPKFIACSPSSSPFVILCGGSARPCKGLGNFLQHRQLRPAWTPIILSMAPESPNPSRANASVTKSGIPSGQKILRGSPDFGALLHPAVHALRQSLGKLIERLFEIRLQRPQIHPQAVQHIAAPGFHRPSGYSSILSYSRAAVRGIPATAAPSVMVSEVSAWSRFPEAPPLSGRKPRQKLSASSPSRGASS